MNFKEILKYYTDCYNPKGSEKKPERPLYPCGYKLCTNTDLAVVSENETEIVVYCKEHDANTSWSKKKGLPVKVIRPTWSMDVHNINKK